jgi:CSLREA domain-containing protein
MSMRQRRKKAKQRRHGRPAVGRRRLAAGAGLGIGASMALGATAQADTFTVDTLSDTPTGTCPPTSCSLREAVYTANLTTASDDIVFATGLSGTITLEYGYLGVDHPINVFGPGPGEITVDGSDSNRVFSIFTTGAGDDVLIDGLTLANGYTYNFNGGAVGIGGTSPDVTISNSVVTGSSALGTNADGGAIGVYNGTLTVQSSTLTGNHTGESGGAIFSYGSELTIENSTISYNYADSFGGGGVYSGDTDFTLRNSTVSYNHADNYHGGGIEAFGANDPTIEGSTISRNSANYGGGISSNNNVSFADPLLTNTIVADNTAGTAYPDVRGDFDAKFSLIEDSYPGSGYTVDETVANSVITGVDPQLGPLGDNGGPTQTEALPLGSPALDKGSQSGTDQRGRPRPFDYPSVPNSPAIGANGADIGAFELQPAPPAVAPGAAPKCKGKTATVFRANGRTLTGTNKRDVIVGTNKKDKISSRGGNDLVCAKGGNDTVNGGGGKDKLYGQGGKDKLKGAGGNDKLVGGGGKDKLIGGPGKDKLLGKGGNDTCVGGPGVDVTKSC